MHTNQPFFITITALYFRSLSLRYYLPLQTYIELFVYSPQLRRDFLMAFLPLIHGDIAMWARSIYEP